ncbi:cation diffusion facilitator family transporter [Capnocytophaga gingivalis]|jgi:cation diffusion facilitator family transporter|uniref:cation diffusion facilitator family transporter n=1 Tax=Capnocytophaga gingivalis TaxID=1017 RepID=UPI003C704D78
MEHHEHDHHGHHHHHVPDLKRINQAFYVGIGANALYTIIEFVVGIRINSLALISDASHNLSDVATLIISLLGMKLAQKGATALYTYGYKKASILASFVNAVILCLIVIKIGVESIERFSHPPQMQGVMIIITALIGILINGLSAFLFYKGQKDDINIKGAFLHLMVDALVSLGVIVSGALIALTGWNIIDPIISFVIAFVILFSTWSLLKESIKLILDGVPHQLSNEHIQEVLLRHPKISSVHHVHIWALSSSENALTAHLVVEEGVSLEDFMEIKEQLKHTLFHEGIQHTTLEIDASTFCCGDTTCSCYQHKD